jgi:hypothetical protein
MTYWVIQNDCDQVWQLMYENLCGNCVDEVCMTFHKRAFDFFDIITH